MSPDTAPARRAPIREVAAARTSYHRARTALEALPERRLAGAPSALFALARLSLLGLWGLPSLVRHPATRSSPTSTDIDRSWQRFVDQRRALVSGLPLAVAKGSFAESLAATAELAETFDLLVRKQLPLAHRAVVADYEAGYDPSAAYASYRCDAANRGRVGRPARVDDGPPRSTPIGGLIWPSAVIDAEGNAYLGHADGEFVSLAPDGSVRWRHADPQMLYIDSTGALGRDGFLYMASTDVDPRGHQNQGRIWKLDPSTGEVAWAFWGRHFEDPEDSEDAHLSSFFEGNLSLGWEEGRVVVYAGSDDGFLYKLDDAGELVWEYDTEAYPSGVIWTKPLLSPDGQTVYVGDLAGFVHAVDTATGQRRWRVRLGGSVVSSPALGRFGEIFLGGFDGRVYALEPADGSVLWTYQTLGLIYASPAVTGDGDVVIGSSDGGVYRLDRFGRKQWVYRTDGAVKGSALLDADDRVFVGNAAGKVYCLDAEGRRVWSYQTHPDQADNDLNASPSMTPDGRVLIGSTTGHLWSLPADLHRVAPDDPAVDTEPGQDGLQPNLPPGGATCVYMDRLGTPRFDLDEPIAVTDNLNFAFFAVDEDLNVVAAELVPGSVQATLRPDLPHELRVESMGRFVYIVPGDFLPYDTEVEVEVSGRYRVDGSERSFTATRRVRTEPRPADPELPVQVGDGVVIHSATLCQPKEIDALGQAMMDSLTFAISPLLIDREHHTLVAAVSDVTQGPEGFGYTPASVNKMVVAGVYRDRAFRVEGGLRLIAQGANIPIQTFRLSGIIGDGPTIDRANAYVVCPAEGVPAFAELVRVMRLADEHDDVVGFTTTSSATFDSEALRAPEGLEATLVREGDQVVAQVSAPGYRAADHWVQIVVVDPAAPRVLDAGPAEVLTDDEGLLTGVRVSLPEDAGARCVAILALDLCAAATLAL